MADFEPHFEETEEVIRERMLARLPSDWRKEPGDFVFDTVACSPAEIKQLEINQDYILKSSAPQYAEGEALDNLLTQRGLVRGAAVATIRSLKIVADAGVTIPAGQVISTVVLDDGGNPVQYTTTTETTWTVAGELTLTATCQTAGALGNVAAGTEFILVPPLPGITSITDNGNSIPGSDTETDTAAYARWVFDVNNPDTGGNQNDYIRWLMDGDSGISGIGKVLPIPRWNGNGTVKLVLVGSDMQPASSLIVTEAQEYIDPDSAGLGEGKAPCGAAVTVVAATPLAINIAATVTYAAGYNAAICLPKFRDALQVYLTSIIFTNQSVVYNYVSGLLAFTAGVSNFTGLTINAGTSDVVIPVASIPIIGTVSI